jgi:hypothetical protein
VINVLNTTGARCAGASLAGRSGRALIHQAAENLREQSAASQRGRPRQNRRIHPQMGVDDAAVGRRARRAHIRACACRCRDHTGAEIHPGDRRKGLGSASHAAIAASVNHGRASELAQGDVKAAQFVTLCCCFRRVMAAILIRLEWNGDCPGSEMGPLVHRPLLLAKRPIRAKWSAEPEVKNLTGAAHGGAVPIVSITLPGAIVSEQPHSWRKQ